MEPASSLPTRRSNVARAWARDSAIVIIPSGLPVSIAGTDQSHDFHAHPEYFYLSGVAAPANVLTFDPADGWSLFAPIPTEEDRIWVGEGASLQELATRARFDAVQPLSRLARWIEQRRGEPVALLGNPDIASHPGAYGIENWSALELDIDPVLSAHLSDQVSEARRAKQPDELDAMRAAARFSLAGHLAGLRRARPGMTERDLQIEIEAEFFRAGAERAAYGSIVGSGSNAAVLHFAPTTRALCEGDLILVDAGAESAGYASDITRTYPAGARFSVAQRDLYQLVLSVQEGAIAEVRPGVEYRDLHMQAALRIAAGLADLGILRGNPEELVERDAHALFFPHGLGHMLGLSTHDAGGCLAGRTKSDRFGLRYLRADLPLEPGYVVTIEPGIYFIPPLLNDPNRRDAFSDAVNWEKVDRLLDFGGIRIEDDVLVTEAGAEVLTAAIPKSIEEIEAIRGATAQS
jgi:Xaa-Pro aminopeptidase